MIGRKDKVEEHKMFRENYSTRKKAMISKIQKINFGSAPLPPPHPHRKGKTNVSWIGRFSFGKSNLNVYQEYIKSSFTVLWLLWKFLTKAHQ